LGEGIVVVLGGGGVILGGGIILGGVIVVVVVIVHGDKRFGVQTRSDEKPIDVSPPNTKFTSPLNRLFAIEQESNSDDDAKDDLLLLQLVIVEFI